MCLNLFHGRLKQVCFIWLSRCPMGCHLYVLSPCFLFSLPPSPDFWTCPLIQHVQPQHPTSTSPQPLCSLGCWWVFCLVLRCIINLWRKQNGGRVAGEPDWICWRRNTCRCFRSEQKRCHSDRMYYVNFTNTWRQILRLLNITEKKKYWFVDYTFGVFSINHAWKEDAVWLCVLTSNSTFWRISNFLKLIRQLYSG